LRSRFRPNPRPIFARSRSPLRPLPDRSSVSPYQPRSLTQMLGTLAHFARQFRRPTLAVVATAAVVLPALSPSSSAWARGPESIADVAERVIDAVVNISTSQKIETRNTPMPQLPNDPQLDELFRDFFNRRGQGDPQNRGPRRVNSLGSGFIIDS